MKRLSLGVLNKLFVVLSGLIVLASLGCGSLGTQGGGDRGSGLDRPAGTSNPSPDLIKVGDPIIIEFSGAPDAPPKVAERLKEDGLIRLPLLKEPIKVVGKTRSELEQEIHNAYVDGFYQRLTVKVGVEGRFFTVAGEVRLPNRYPYLCEMTVLQAIATAGDFTDFAARSRVEVIRGNNKPIRVDCKDAASDATKNIQIFPDDYIKVPRQIFFD